MNAKEAFRQEYGDSRNFVTPRIISRGTIRKGMIFYELSTGRGIFEETSLFGVTIVKYDKEKGETERLTDLSQCFHSQDEAKKYIDQLKKEL